jgi:hypothetical protein
VTQLPKCGWLVLCAAQAGCREGASGEPPLAAYNRVPVSQSDTSSQQLHSCCHFGLPKWQQAAADCSIAVEQAAQGAASCSPLLLSGQLWLRPIWLRGISDEQGHRIAVDFAEEDLRNEPDWSNTFRACHGKRVQVVGELEGPRPLRSSRGVERVVVLRWIRESDCVGN